MFRRPTKRPRLKGGEEAGKEPPPVRCWMDADSSSAAGVVIATDFWSREIFVQRFQKEILDKFHFSLSSSSRIQQIQDDDVEANNKDERHQTLLIKQRIRVGMNAVTQSLEEATNACYNNNNNKGSCNKKARKPPSPLLVVLTTTSTDDNANNALTAQHLQVLAYALKTPVLRLSLSPKELGKLLGTKHVAVFSILAQQKQHQNVCITTTSVPTTTTSRTTNPHHHEADDDHSIIAVHHAIDSFTNYIRGKMSSQKMGC